MFRTEGGGHRGRGRLKPRWIHWVDEDARKLVCRNWLADAQDGGRWQHCLRPWPIHGCRAEYDNDDGDDGNWFEETGCGCPRERSLATLLEETKPHSGLLSWIWWWWLWWWWWWKLGSRNWLVNAQDSGRWRHCLRRPRPTQGCWAEYDDDDDDYDDDDDDGNWVQEVGWWMPRIEVAGNIVWGDQGPLRAAEPRMMVMMMIMIMMMMMEIDL